MLKRSIMIAALMAIATPAAAGWTLPCLFGGCSITLVSPEYAAKPVQPLDPEKALAQVNAYRTKNGRKPVVLDTRLSQAAAAQSKAQAGRSRIGHDGSDGSKPMQRAARAGFRAKIASENVASGQKSFSDVMKSWEGSSGHRENLLRPEVTAIGVAMAKNRAAAPIGPWCSAPSSSDCRAFAATIAIDLARIPTRLRRNVAGCESRLSCLAPVDIVPAYRVIWKRERFHGAGAEGQ